jgi:enhancer of polycomb-like protein
MVKRREKYKRLMVDFLDETRRQSLHETIAAHVTSMAPRVPKIPTEEDREAKHKKKKKKKDNKKHRRDSMENYDSVHDPSFLSSSLGVDEHAALKQHYAHGHPHHSMKSNSFMDVQRMAVPTFLELPRYIHSFLMATNDSTNTTAVDHRYLSESSCSFPTYPQSTEQLHAALFADGPPRFRCRGRIGRGGRLIVDRIPVYESWIEWEAPPNHLPFSSSSTTRTSSSSSTLNHYHHNYHAAVATVAPPPKEKRIARARVVESICNMSDSEDEIVSVDVPAEEDKLRPLKYTLAI